ncbi:tetratricopeptide repeat protein [Taklimakanibacter albus]|uniref:Sel1 repeat family protein n=1 Tax=Taklimakanibacter albus TaxID=2800327 RepID=A0ACC5R443_9HYPH|nr:tetratricopeptide repeat protein [Aestuariivirga sp. YIM B02566]MBK1867143.1 sel1 repeat family protein [Aestuariivirga sp. YIM B02566]
MLNTNFPTFKARRVNHMRRIFCVSLAGLSMMLIPTVHAQSSTNSAPAVAEQTVAAATTETALPNAGESLSAQRERGENLITGWNTTQNKEEGVKLLEAAIEKGDRRSLIILGRLYMDGQFLKRDHRRALDLFQRAAKNGDFEGVEALGETLMWDAKTPADRREAERLLNLAGTGGRGSAWTTLAYGALYDKLSSAANANYNTYVEKARALGDAQIEIVEAERLLYRASRRPNPSAAIASLEKAASGGNSEAIKYLVKLYRDGNGYNVKRNLAKARAYLKKYGTKLSSETQQQQAFLLQAAVARSSTEFSKLAHTARARTDFTSTDFQRQLYQSNQNFSIYLAQDKLREKNLYKGPLNGRATTRTMASLRDVCKTLVWKGNCDKKILSDRSLAAIIAN